MAADLVLLANVPLYRRAARNHHPPANEKRGVTAVSPPSSQPTGGGGRVGGLHEVALEDANLLNSALHL